jgi:hypothetical protein
MAIDGPVDGSIDNRPGRQFLPRTGEIVPGEGPGGLLYACAKPLTNNGLKCLAGMARGLHPW